MKPPVKPAAHLRVEWLPKMPWNECPRSRGIDAHLPWNAQVPPPGAYFDPINWHRTALHELCHWSGAEKRLARDFSGAFGSKTYSREELVAELGAAFTCAAFGITPTVRHSDYIASWLDVLRQDNRAIVRTASQASKASNFLLGFLNGAAGQGAQIGGSVYTYVDAASEVAVAI